MPAKKLPTATLGRTGLKITRLGFGAMELRDAPRGRPVSDDQAKAILNAVLDSGISFIDTSNDYGRSEEFIGKLISGRRSQYYLATKCGCIPGGGPHIWTKENMFRGLNESLSRLKVDYVDLMQLHGPTVEDAKRGDVVSVLQEMKRQGKVRWIGCSTTLPELPTYLQWGVFDEFQIPYSALQREHEEWITKSAKAGIGTVIRGGVAKGEPGVSGMGITYQRGGVAVKATDVWKPFTDAKLDELREEGEGRTSFMLRFTLSHPSVNTIIVGTLNPAHLEENVRAAQRGPLAAKIYAEAKRRLDGVGMKPAAA